MAGVDWKEEKKKSKSVRRQSESLCTQRQPGVGLERRKNGSVGYMQRLLTERQNAEGLLNLDANLFDTQKQEADDS